MKASSFGEVKPAARGKFVEQQKQPVTGAMPSGLSGLSISRRLICLHSRRISALVRLTSNGGTTKPFDSRPKCKDQRRAAARR